MVLRKSDKNLRIVHNLYIGTIINDGEIEGSVKAAVEALVTGDDNDEL